MHPLLLRQLKRHRGSTESIPPEWKNFVEAVDAAYQQADEDRTLLERSLELASDELMERNQQLQEKNQALEITLRKLKEMQNQLIVQEKMASLGALTAGIAHEIKNPLNFVNNLSIIAAELAQELRETLEGQKEKPQAAENIADLLQNLQQAAEKICAHGKRADAIVQSMMLHSRGKAGERHPTDINALLDEYLKLAYHGLRARDHTFNITMNTAYDASLGKLNIVPQDLGRVFLNLVNNGCYAAFEKKKALGHDFSPTISVCTKNLGDKIEIRIRDNGNGIPPSLQDKIFTPFFTTKPTGQGTGLGLSISYDIIVQEHKGELRFVTAAGSFTEFIISLPRSA